MQWGTGWGSTRSARPSRRVRCFPRAGWAPPGSSASTSASKRRLPRVHPGAPTSAVLISGSSAATRTRVRRRMSSAATARRSTRRRPASKFKMRCGRPCVRVRWTGLDAAGGAREALDSLTYREAAIAAFEQATSRPLPRPAPSPPPFAGAAAASPPSPPFGRGGAPRRSGLGADGPTTAGSAAPSPASAHAAPSRTSWSTRRRGRRCAGRWTRSSMPPPTLSLGAALVGRRRRSCPGPARTGLPVVPGRRSWRAATDHDSE